MSLTNEQPAAPTLPGPPGAKRGGRTRIVLQLLGFLASIVLLGWCIHIAMAPKNAAKFATLWAAPIEQKALLLSLSVALLLLDGAKFWAVLRPVRKLRFWDVQAVNGIAAFATYAPFKLSVIVRFIIHNRRDKVPIFTIGAWMGAVGMILLGAVLPLVAVSLWRKRVDGMFFVTGLAGLVTTAATLCLIARYFAGSRGLARIQRLGAAFRLSIVQRLLASNPFAKAHAGFDMLADPPTIAAGYTLRVANLLVGAARFYVVARMLGTPIGIDTSILAACTFFIVGVASPSGSLGAREGATMGLAALVVIPGLEKGEFDPITIFVSMTEILIYFIGAVFGAGWLLATRAEAD